eukprot:TRINITY_DN3199_c1_g2_i1.p1 TRINITY_DN3199_c1_g2~~TRINITY_DN3199_c1_g2_i1.p1  ORF type:complete len:793 (-),score=244.59 TRINITY_DN3199_c1_g2_i1:864-3242(-)
MNFLKKKAKNVMKMSEDPYTTSTFLHGYILLDVFEASELPDMEGWLSKVVDSKDLTDAFVDVKLGKAKLAKTSVILNSLNPTWNESYRVEVCHFAEDLVFEIRDKDHAYSEFIGEVRLSTRELLNGNTREGWFDIMKKNGNPQGNAKLSFRIVYVSKICINKTYEVDSYFPIQRNCSVTLYQDAHCYRDMPVFANLMGPEGEKHEPRSCWTDVFHSIVGAQKLICITGWAVWHKLELFRGFDQSDIYDGTLGDLLLRKAEEGVNVYVMVWSEKTSGDIIGEKGVMGTHDMETYNFFKNTKVNCALAPRELGTINELTDVLQNEFATGAYTHHQKTIICDVDDYRLEAYVGGLDLTGGRWDTPDHQLYSTLTNEHCEDFRNSNAGTVPPSQGPREPWHDIHCKVEGPIAHDVFINFYERWLQQGMKYGRLDPIDTSDININAAAPNVSPSKFWNCQLFRSITSDSAMFDPARTEVMNSKKGRLVEASIAQAYIQMIRNAENFLYFENQYFLGSAYAWKSNDDVNCHHVIPREIAQKVVDKIYAGERFCAYIVIPMFPEGDPSSAPIQEILYWQTRTIEMMYGRIGEALKHAELPSHLGTHPTDWLLFLCPGKRELPGPHLDNLDPPTENMAAKFRKTLRFPIYVHSKMFIVDDVYVLVGSANINQRSMAGTRDTEIAVGSWQPAYTPESPYGDVHMFRMALWNEHLRTREDVFVNPGTLECVQRVKEMVLHNWNTYRGEALQETPGQLLAYPLNILVDGTIELLEDCKTFPDFPSGSKITGKVSAMIPQKVTT